MDGIVDELQSQDSDDHGHEHGVAPDPGVAGVRFDGHGDAHSIEVLLSQLQDFADDAVHVDELRLPVSLAHETGERGQGSPGIGQVDKGFAP